MKICLSGTQSTGKTTILNAIEKELKNRDTEKNKNFKIIKEVVRGLVKDNKIAINKEMSHKGQMIVLEEHYKNCCLRYNHFITDRGIIDAFCYGTYLYLNGKYTYSEHNEQLALFKEVVNKYDHYIYLPPVLKLVSDGTRSLDKEYRDEVHNIFTMVYNSFCTHPVTILNDINLENRVYYILSLIGE